MMRSMRSGDIDLRAPVGSGMVATSQPLAVRAGVEALAAGGTAADAAVAAAAVLCVTEPLGTGVGGDAFALYWPPGAAEPIGLDGAGPSGAGATLEAIRAAGHRAMPSRGPWTITAPGAVDAWATLLDRFGRLSLADALVAAIAIARDGFEVTPFIAAQWAAAAGTVAGDEAASAVFMPGGRAPAAGERFANADLAGLLELIARDGADTFYRGEPAQLIGDAVERAGGPLRAGDLAQWTGARWVEPISGSFRDAEVFELPPPGQGMVALEALGIFAGLDHGDAVGAEHAAIESLKLAFEDASAHLADPLVEDVPVDALLGDEHLAARRAEIGPRARASAPPGPASDTVYVAAVDASGGACSFIQSLYASFGSGVGVPGLGITLQNRGAGFVLDPRHPNRLAPGKRPYHTIIPAMVARDAAFHGCLGVVGGFMQPQGHMQVLRHVLDGGRNLGEALAEPRMRFLGGREVGAEPGCDPALLTGLSDRGHEIRPLAPADAGGAQAIFRDGDQLAGASDPRRDGCVGVTPASERSRSPR
jgi:gamma-glutamyltranspeptidase/glutathione hydrolase